jgi:iron complex transport system substrate-binding protein
VFDLINRDIETYETLFGTRDTATRSVADLRQRVARAQEQTANKPETPTAALYMYADDPLGAYGNNAVVHEQLSIIRLKNVFADTNKRYLEPTVEEIIARNPELVIALYIPEQSQLPTPQSVIQELQSRQELASITAICDNAIIPFGYYYSGPGPLAVEGLEQLAKQVADRN